MKRPLAGVGLATVLVAGILLTICPGFSVMSNQGADGLSLFLFEPAVKDNTATLNGVQQGAPGQPKWNWGDGTTEEYHLFPNTHTYGKRGTYTISVTACSATSKCITSTKSVVIRVSPVPSTTKPSNGSVVLPLTTKATISRLSLIKPLDKPKDLSSPIKPLDKLDTIPFVTSKKKPQASIPFITSQKKSQDSLRFIKPLNNSGIQSSNQNSSGNLFQSMTTTTTTSSLVTKDDHCYYVLEGCKNAHGMESITCIDGHWVCRKPLIDSVDWKQLGKQIGISFIHDASCAACGPACLLLGAAGGLPGVICGGACLVYCSMPM